MSSVEIVRMLFGSIGLVLSVPVTTGLAALILTHTELPEDDGHGHLPHPAPQLDQGWHSPNPRRDQLDQGWHSPNPRRDQRDQAWPSPNPRRDRHDDPWF